MRGGVGVSCFFAGPHWQCQVGTPGGVCSATATATGTWQWARAVRSTSGHARKPTASRGPPHSLRGRSTRGGVHTRSVECGRDPACTTRRARLRQRPTLPRRCARAARSPRLVGDALQRDVTLHARGKEGGEVGLLGRVAGGEENVFCGRAAARPRWAASGSTQGRRAAQKRERLRVKDTRLRASASKPPASAPTRASRAAVPPAPLSPAARTRAMPCTARARSVTAQDGGVAAAQQQRARWRVGRGQVEQRGQARRAMARRTARAC
jgi:hypothetical protein